MKDLVFKGPRPYGSEPLEKFLRQEFGESVKMKSVLHPRYERTLLGVVSDEENLSSSLSVGFFGLFQSSSYWSSC